MTQFNPPTYDVARPTGECAFTGRKLEPGEPYVATLVELDEKNAAAGGPAAALGFKRLDVSIEAWQPGQRPKGLFGHWKTTVPLPNQKKKLFVDDDVLLNLFERLADTDQPQRLAFRFVLALILMRKRLLKYEGSQQRQTEQGEQEWWLMTPKGRTESLDVLNPQLNENRVQ